MSGKLTITIDCDNAAFIPGERHYEVARLLERTINTIERNGGAFLYSSTSNAPLVDINGNRVGQVNWENLRD